MMCAACSSGCCNVTVASCCGGAMVLTVTVLPYHCEPLRYGGKLLPYELDEARGWSLDLASLTKQVAAARREGYAIR